MKSKLTVLVLALALATAGCNGGGGTDPDDSNGISQDPSFSNEIQPVFTTNCASSNCHGAAESAGLSLESGEAYAELVNVTSTSEPEYVRVLPDRPDSSYLVIKIEGDQSVGSRMPLTGGPLSSDTIQLIRNWISAGAEND